MNRLLMILPFALACSGAPFEGETSATVSPVDGGAGDGGGLDMLEPVASAGAPVAGLAGGGAGGSMAGGGGRAGEAPSSLAGADAGQGGAVPIAAGAGGTGGQAPVAGQAGQGGSPQPAPNACEPPSKTGPISGARDCTGDCRYGEFPCEGTCQDVPPGGCTGEYMLGAAGADMSFVLEPGDPWTFSVAPGVCARLTAMPSAGLKIGTKPATCWSVCAGEVEQVLASVGKRAWLRAETSSQPLPCAP